ncbi:hypothetical protein D0Y65_030724 [Glycine soja]|uniref:Tf2-1-like SH3-like domain-containing protein n=1 Tax=Glycine soja TaxID=3848 RepID=A0A445I521_GLYSO|nr:hypothetical protein D0Y65_030724 [Glycine soja]
MLLNRLKGNLINAQTAMKIQADKKRLDRNFQVGDEVLVKLQPYRQHSAALRKNQKLSIRYFDPFTVLEKIGKVAYKLQLPDTTKIHPVFHASQLKQFQRASTEPYVSLPLSTFELGPLLGPMDILETWIIVKGSTLIPQVLIQWQGNGKAKSAKEREKEKLVTNGPRNVGGRKDSRVRLANRLRDKREG